MSSSNCSFCSTLRNLWRSTLSSFSFCTTWFLACLSNLFKTCTFNDLRNFSSTNFWCFSLKLKALFLVAYSWGKGNTHNSIFHNRLSKDTAENPYNKQCKNRQQSEGSLPFPLEFRIYQLKCKCDKVNITAYWLREYCQYSLFCSGSRKRWSKLNSTAPVRARGAFSSCNFTTTWELPLPPPTTEQILDVSISVRGKRCRNAWSVPQKTQNLLESKSKFLTDLSDYALQIIFQR